MLAIPQFWYAIIFLITKKSNLEYNFSFQKLQHEIERFYGSQSDEGEEANAKIQLEYLLNKYNTLRNNVF